MNELDKFLQERDPKAHHKDLLISQLDLARLVDACIEEATQALESEVERWQDDYYSELHRAEDLKELLNKELQNDE